MAAINPAIAHNPKTHIHNRKHYNRLMKLVFSAHSSNCDYESNLFLLIYLFIILFETRFTLSVKSAPKQQNNTVKGRRALWENKLYHKRRPMWAKTTIKITELVLRRSLCDCTYIWVRHCLKTEISKTCSTIPNPHALYAVAPSILRL